MLIIVAFQQLLHFNLLVFLLQCKTYALQFHANVAVWLHLRLKALCGLHLDIDIETQLAYFKNED